MTTSTRQAGGIFGGAPRAANVQLSIKQLPKSQQSNIFDTFKTPIVDITTDQIKLLGDLKLSNGQSILADIDQTSKDLVYEIINNIKNPDVGFSKLYEKIKSYDGKLAYQKDVYFILPNMEIMIAQAETDMNNEQYKPEIREGPKCGKCGSTNTIQRPKQIRRADEPETIFCQCISCGYHWRA